MSKRLRELWLSKITGPHKVEFLSEIVAFRFLRPTSRPRPSRRPSLLAEEIGLTFDLSDRQFDAVHWSRRGSLDRSYDLARAMVPLLTSRLTPEQLAACTAAAFNYGNSNHAIR